jgi:hypothetical protein
MITANELRIGNLIENGEVEGIHFTERIIEVVKNKTRTFVRMEFAEPIPLTPEILEKRCGFVDDKLNIRYGLDFGYIHYMKELGGIIYRSDYNHGMSRTFKYLHQFQNLVFALTGEDPEIKALC